MGRKELIESESQSDMEKEEAKEVNSVDDNEIKVLKLKGLVYDWLARMENAQAQIVQCRDNIDKLNSEIERLSKE